MDIPASVPSDISPHDEVMGQVLHHSSEPAGGVVSTIAEVEATVQATSVPLVGGPSDVGGFVGVAQNGASGAKQTRPTRQGKQVPRWTAEEEEKLKAMIGDGEPRGKWAEIAAQMGNERSAMSVEQHWCDGGPARRFPPRGALCLHRDIAMNALAVPLAMSPLSPLGFFPRTHAPLTLGRHARTRRSRAGKL